MKKRNSIFSIGIVLLVSGLLISCGQDTDGTEKLNIISTESATDKLYKELVGSYNLFKAELTYTDQPTRVLVPPDISGQMTITSDQKMIQTVVVFGTGLSVSGTFEIRPDEKTLLIDNDNSDIISKTAYTWNGAVLTTTLDTGAFVEKDYWRKL